MTDPAGKDVFQYMRQDFRQYLRDAKHFVFSNDETAQLARAHFTQDEQSIQNVRLVADVVGLVPRAGSIWKHNILYATGLESTQDFGIHQAANSVALGSAMIGGDVGTTAGKFSGVFAGRTLKNNLLYATGRRDFNQFAFHLFADTGAAGMKVKNASWIRKWIYRLGVPALDLWGFPRPSAVYANRSWLGTMGTPPGQGK